MNRRVVLETSVLVSAALRIASVPHRALQQALATCVICASLETLDELECVLDRKKSDRYLDRATRRAFTKLVRHHARLFAVEETALTALEPSCRDPDDNKFLALAQLAEADVLVTSDDDLRVPSPWNGIAIVTPDTFLTSGVLV